MTNMIAPSPENGATSIEEMPIQISGFNVDGCHLFRFGNLPFCQCGKICRRRDHECAYQFGMCFRVSFSGVAVYRSDCHL